MNGISIGVRFQIQVDRLNPYEMLLLMQELKLLSIIKNKEYKDAEYSLTRAEAARLRRLYDNGYKLYTITAAVG